jgi:hypothetical protein
VYVNVALRRSQDDVSDLTVSKRQSIPIINKGKLCIIVIVCTNYLWPWHLSFVPIERVWVRVAVNERVRAIGWCGIDVPRNGDFEKRDSTFYPLFILHSGMNPRLFHHSIPRVLQLNLSTVHTVTKLSSLRSADGVVQLVSLEFGRSARPVRNQCMESFWMCHNKRLK